MDALQMLRNDHLKVKDLFRRFDEAEDGSTRKAIVDEAIAELMIHSQVEEEVFYPAMEREGLTALVRHSEEEHAAADRIMVELSQMGARDKMLAPRFRVLVETVTAHIDDEESQMFPRAAELTRERLARIGEQIEALRERLTTTTQTERSPAATATAPRTAGTTSTRVSRKPAPRKRGTGTTRTVAKRTTAKRTNGAARTKRTTAKSATGATGPTAKRTIAKSTNGATRTKRTTAKSATGATRPTAKRTIAKSTNGATRSTSTKRAAPTASRPAARKTATRAKTTARSTTTRTSRARTSAGTR